MAGRKASRDASRKLNLASLIERARESGRPVEVSSSALLLSKEQYNELLATIEFQREVGKGLADIAAGRTEPWKNVRDELLAKLHAAHRAAPKKAKRA